MQNTNIQQNKGHRRLRISRRDFLYTSSLALAAFSLPNFTGCTKRYPTEDCIAATGGQALIETQGNMFNNAAIGGIKVKNRFVRSATTLGSADSAGRPTETLLDQYRSLAKGGVGTIITGLGDTGLILDRDIYVEADVEKYAKVSEVAHRHHSAVIQQIGHPGSQTEMSGPDGRGFYINKATDAEIELLIDKFVTAIARSKQTGFDGVQLHGAHGYLLSSTLSPGENQRTDKWGGNTQNRFRFIKEIFNRSKRKNGDFPIFIKINAYDFQKNGMRVEEAVKISKLLEETGCAGIEVSCGVGKDGFSTLRVTEIPTEAIIEFTPYGENLSNFKRKISPLLMKLAVKRYEPLYNYNVCAAKKIKENVTIPVIAVGGIHHKADAQQVIDRGAADFVAMSRPFIIEPDIVSRFEKNVQTSSECIHCGYCIVSLASRPVECFYGSV